MWKNNSIHALALYIWLLISGSLKAAKAGMWGPRCLIGDIIFISLRVGGRAPN
jgi:hypothetical protein